MAPCEIHWEKDSATGIYTFFPTWRQLRKLSFTECILQIESLKDAVELGVVRVRMPTGYRPRQKLYNPKEISKVRGRSRFRRYKVQVMKFVKISFISQPADFLFDLKPFQELKIKSFRQEFYSHGNGCFEIHYEPTRVSFDEFYQVTNQFRVKEI